MSALGNQEDLIQFVLDLLPSNSPESLKTLVRNEFTDQFEAVVARRIDLYNNGGLSKIVCNVKSEAING